jgi:signal transduction histidine kinase
MAEENECRFACPNCSTEIAIPVPAEKKCTGIDCPYTFQVFSKRDREKAREAYLLRPSKKLKYFKNAPDGRWFIGYAQKAEPFIAETLCDLISAPVLQTIQAGLVKRLHCAVTILVKFRKCQKGSDSIEIIEDNEGIRFGRIDPIEKFAGFTPLCSKIRAAQKGEERCKCFDIEIAKELFRSNDPKDWEPKWYPCWAGLVDFVAPIVINDFIVAVMFTGQIRWTDPEGQNNLSIGIQEAAKIAGCSEQDLFRIADLPTQPKMNREGLDKFLKDFTDHVETIKALAESRYWAERRVRESEFLSEIFTSFATVDDEVSLWKVIAAILKRINEFSLFGYSAFFLQTSGVVEDFELKAKDGIGQVKSQLLEFSLTEYEILFKKETLVPIREIQKTICSELYDKIIPFLQIGEVNCAYVFPFNLGEKRRGFVFLAERRIIAPDRISRGIVSPRRQEFLGTLIHEIKIEVQNSFHIADLKKALQDRSDLMATAGHLLVAPLDAAYGKTELITLLIKKVAQIPYNSQRIKELCDQLDKDILYCVRRTRSFMFFTTMGTAAERYRFDREISITNIMNECKDDFQFLAEIRGIFIKLLVHENIPPANFDGERLQIAFSNLVDNAVKYSHTNHVINIDIHFNKTTEIYTISISDFGLGIPPKEQGTIFASYIRSKMQDPRRFIPGTGIGLSVVMQIIKAHNGKIWVTSRQGRDISGAGSSSIEGFNTTFWIKLHRKRKVVE